MDTKDFAINVACILYTLCFAYATTYLGARVVDEFPTSAIALGAFGLCTLSASATALYILATDIIFEIRYPRY